MNTQQFSKRLRQARLDAGFTQEVLARRIGRCRVTITNYEAGRAQPSADVLGRLASQLSLTTDYLLGLAVLPPRHNGKRRSTGTHRQ